MKSENLARLFMLTAIVISGYMGGSFFGGATQAQAAGKGTGGGGHITHYDIVDSAVEADAQVGSDTEGNAQFMDEGSASDDEESSASHSDVEWKYVPVRR